MARYPFWCPVWLGIPCNWGKYYDGVSLYHLDGNQRLLLGKVYQLYFSFLSQGSSFLGLCPIIYTTTFMNDSITLYTFNYGRAELDNIHGHVSVSSYDVYQ